MKVNKRTLSRIIKASLPDFNKEKSASGMWGRDLIKKLDFLGQEIVTMRMDASR
jgi:hypothetical protein